MTRIPFDEMKATIKMAFTLAGMPEDKAEICARTHAESSMDGIYSHGLNRVERFVDCCLSVCTHSSLPLGLSFCVDGEGVDCDCLADLLLSGGSVAVGG